MKNIGLYIIYNILLLKITTLYQVIYSHWNSDLYIEYNIAATKSSFAATIDVSVPQCHLDLRGSLII